MSLLEVFVPGPLHNPLNGSHGDWRKHARWARQWRERTHQQLWLALRSSSWPPKNPYAPKRITFLAQTGAKWDDDNLRAGLKPLRDALKDAGLIADDGPTAGHVFSYAQIIDRAHRGVNITIAPIAPIPGGERL